MVQGWGVGVFSLKDCDSSQSQVRNRSFGHCRIRILPFQANCNTLCTLGAGIHGRYPRLRANIQLLWVVVLVVLA